MADVQKVDSFHVGGGGRRKSSLADPARAAQEANRRRTSRASPTPEVGSSSVMSKRLSTSFANTRRRSSNLIPTRKVSGSMLPGSRRPKVQFENTYRMEPMLKFRSDHALSILREVFSRRLRDSKYDAKVCQELAKSMAGEIKHKVKELRFERYKYVVVVTIGQRQDSELIQASRCLLDTQWDTYATFSFENYHVFATGIVYAFYFE